MSAGEQPTPPRVLVAGGGTGGHVFPSLAVASALRDAGLDVEFVGTARGLESRLVPDAGWTLHEVEARPLSRKLSPATLRLPLVLVRATRRVTGLIAERDIAAACVFGGYVSVPLTLAARRTRTPLVVHEQNAVPGLANRLAAQWAEAVAVSVPGTEERFRDRDRVVLTGNPVRPGFGDFDRAATRPDALAAFDLEPDRRTLLVFGGSQGARKLNDAVLGSLAHWSEPGHLQILHAAGRADHERVRAGWETALAAHDGEVPLVRCHGFIAAMETAYAAADVVACRAGASTIAELTVLGLPSVLVPYPHATDDHQTANARALADAGAAKLLPDGWLAPKSLVGMSEPWLNDDAARREAGAAAKALGRPDAAERVARLVARAARRTRAGREGRP
ncbi:MAG TPA: undecaprenyldiphospho-muramoylpentapeptide beta-N-acetylglucosaminyltransferase [Egibacteraceae bacterium]|nr:undecaprenyldiphospho-muramoylpentapeptide beta-N-acetylglucosaminyltransferase [Egibacteraceae bacterium]